MKGDNVYIFNSNHIKPFALIGLHSQGLRNNSWRTIDLQSIDTVHFTLNLLVYTFEVQTWTLALNSHRSTSNIAMQSILTSTTTLGFHQDQPQINSHFLIILLFLSFYITFILLFVLLFSSLPPNSRLSDFCYQQTKHLSRKKKTKKTAFKSFNDLLNTALKTE